MRSVRIKTFSVRTKKTDQIELMPGGSEPSLDAQPHGRFSLVEEQTFYQTVYKSLKVYDTIFLTTYERVWTVK